jgi:hypothetical protein
VLLLFDEIVRAKFDAILLTILFVIALIGDFGDLSDLFLIEVAFFLWHLLSLHFLVPTLHLFIGFFLTHDDFL